MTNKRGFSKIRKGILIGSSVVAIAIITDILIHRDLSHPLTYFNQAVTTFNCRNSNCKNTLPPAISPHKGMVVTSQHLASQVGAKILQQGGNAVDAAVAVGYALAVTDPCCGNIGGGGFMLIHLKNGDNIFINFREKAPQKATATMYLDAKGKVIPKRSTNGYLSVGIPGTVAGLEAALTQYGTLTRNQVMSPAIQLAEEGFILQQGDVDILNRGVKDFQESPNVAAIFLKNQKEPYQVGDRFIQKNLANTLKKISKFGTDTFYQGEIATEIVKASQAEKGILTREDFANYTISKTQPLRCRYRGYEILTSPLPGGGTTLCQMLNILEGYPLTELGWHSSASLHKFLETMLRAYSDRNKNLGDPNFVKNPVDRLLSKDYAAELRKTIIENKATPPEKFYSGITVEKEGENTTHYSIIDQEGNAVAVTYTINGYFGAKVIAGNTGFFLNNEMDDFTAKPGVPNSFGLVQGKANLIAPGKQPLSSMSPTIVTKNNSVILVTGSPGGSTIPTTVLQVITNVIDYNMTVAEAVQAPRIHYQGLPKTVFIEKDSLPETTIKALEKMGYQFRSRSRWGAAESIGIDPKNQIISGANDLRKPAGKAVSVP